METKVNEIVKDVKYTAKDFASDVDVKWCPGCGDYSILAQVQRTSPEFGEKKENITWISGIGCSSRFPYYMNTYGFHGIHGRAAAIATGVKLANGSGATFVARSLDRDPKHLQEMITRASKHKGAAFIEVYQNCPIFNDGAYSLLTEKETKPDNVILLEHGKPLVFGANKEKGIMLDGLNPVIINLNDGKHSINDCWTHDEFDDNPTRVFLLARFTDLPGYPTPIV